MTAMKRILALMLMAVLMLTMTACAGSNSEKEKTEKEKLIAILEDASANVQPGTSGSGLRAAKSAVALITFASKTDMTSKEAAAVVKEWLGGQSDDIKDSFREKMQQVAEAYGQIALDGAKDLLEAAGEQSTVTEITGKLKEIVEEILASGGVNG